jgi:hypothetical protein
LKTKSRALAVSWQEKAGIVHRLRGAFAVVKLSEPPAEPGNDCATGERRFSFPVGLDRNVVAQIGAQIVEVAFFLGHGDQPPVAVSERDFDSEDRGDLSIGLIICKATSATALGSAKGRRAPTQTREKKTRTCACRANPTPAFPDQQMTTSHQGHNNHAESVRTVLSLSVAPQIAHKQRR